MEKYWDIAKRFAFTVYFRIKYAATALINPNDEEFKKFRYEQVMMKQRLKYLDSLPEGTFGDKSYGGYKYIGNINDDWMDHIDAKIKEKENND